jgi:hypothetical protein
MEDNVIYVAVVDGKVSHIYSDQPLRFRVVAWERDDESSIRLSSEYGVSTEKDKLVAELFQLLKEAPYDETLLHQGAVKAQRKE